jgi:hypothetical protein
MGCKTSRESVFDGIEDVILKKTRSKAAKWHLRSGRWRVDRWPDEFGRVRVYLLEDRLVATSPATHRTIYPLTDPQMGRLLEVIILEGNYS